MLYNRNIEELNPLCGTIYYGLLKCCSITSQDISLVFNPIYAFKCYAIGLHVILQNNILQAKQSDCTSTVQDWMDISQKKSDQELKEYDVF